MKTSKVETKSYKFSLHSLTEEEYNTIKDALRRMSRDGASGMPRITMANQQQRDAAHDLFRQLNTTPPTVEEDDELF